MCRFSEALTMHRSPFRMLWPPEQNNSVLEIRLHTWDTHPLIFTPMHILSQSFSGFHTSLPALIEQLLQYRGMVCSHSVALMIFREWVRAAHVRSRWLCSISPRWNLSRISGPGKSPPAKSAGENGATTQMSSIRSTRERHM